MVTLQEAEGGALWVFYRMCPLARGETLPAIVTPSRRVACIILNTGNVLRESLGHLIAIESVALEHYRWDCGPVRNSGRLFAATGNLTPLHGSLSS